MLACLLLDEAEEEVALAEYKGLDLLAVVVPQTLLVDGRAAERQETCFFEQVDAIFAGFSGFRFDVHCDAQRVEPVAGFSDIVVRENRTQ